MTQNVSLPYESNAIALHVNNWVSPLGCNTPSPTKWTKYPIKGISMLVVYIINCFYWMPLLTNISYKTTLIWNGYIGTKLHKLRTECHIAAISINVSSNSRIMYEHQKQIMHAYLFIQMAGRPRWSYSCKTKPLLPPKIFFDSFK